MTQRQGQEGGGKNVLFGIDTSDLLLSAVQDVGEYAGYPRTLGALAPLLTARYGTGRLQAAIHEQPQETTMRFAQFGFTVTMDSPPPSCCGGLRPAVSSPRPATFCKTGPEECRHRGVGSCPLTPSARSPVRSLRRGLPAGPARPGAGRPP